MGTPDDSPEPHEHHHGDAPASDPADHTTWPICPVCDRRIMPDPRRPDRTIHARCEHHLTEPHKASA